VGIQSHGQIDVAVPHHGLGGLGAKGDRKGKRPCARALRLGGVDLDASINATREAESQEAGDEQQAIRPRPRPPFQ